MKMNLYKGDDAPSGGLHGYRNTLLVLNLVQVFQLKYVCLLYFFISSVTGFKPIETVRSFYESFFLYIIMKSH